ncbi:HTH-type transcriptional regulator / antitoxin HigA [Flavobacterium micromati]|uniref:HTH-type transcriptional regulator / antitoxin HigA n=1 Tax=Flavobacterium micromati TaxID=229205 RepID=A0A1M5LQI4_9FLAO|nr:HigA family addiction module antitoxin [Flavobacterium micromati]SHG67226.1 HTH-type transcriptional regulator / antitoxin HigA [Flavobacterium micromati]
MTTTKDIIPSIATHPGSILADEIEANDCSQIDFANLIGLKRSQLNEIIKGKRNINADLALLLEKALGIDADFWLEAQKNYDLDKARIEEKNKMRLEAIEIWTVIKSFIPIAFFKKVKIISGDPCIDIDTIKGIYKVESLDELAIMSMQSNFARFKKSTKLKTDVIHIMGWVKLVQHTALKIHVVPFNHEKKEELIAQLRAIFVKNENLLESIQNCLFEHGIKLIYQEKGEKTPVDGVSFWSNRNPAIGMTLRHKRVDNFAFTLFHELGHIYEHLINNNKAEFIDLDIKTEADDYKNSLEEIEANHFAQNNLIPHADWIHFKKENPFLNVDEAIILFAKQVKIHPSIVRGRVCFELNDFRSFTIIDNAIH